MLQFWPLQGKLGQLVQLIHSMSFLTGGLASIMAAFKPQQGAVGLVHAGSNAADSLQQQQPQQQEEGLAGDAALSPAAAATAAALQGEGELTVEVLISCVLAAVEELPVWESTEVEQVGELLVIISLYPEPYSALSMTL